eukprot:5949542-Lingulodinium_polyedra.AAC.1
MSSPTGSMASGMAAGAGMSVANRAVDAAMGPRTTGSMASGMATGVGMGVASHAVDAAMGPRQTEAVHQQKLQQ